MSVVIQLPRDINKLCRTCMKVAEDQDDSFEHRIVSNNQLTELSKMLESVTSLKISVNDGLPETLCSQCTEYLNIAYLFKNHCSNVDRDLRELICMSETKDCSSSTHTDCKLPFTNVDADCSFICHICLVSMKSNYELSKHLIEHNMNKSLTERFMDSCHDVKPTVSIAEKEIFDQIIERKLYTLVGMQENSRIKKEALQKTLNNGHVEGKSESDEQLLEIECDTCGVGFQSAFELNSHTCGIEESNCEILEKDAEVSFKCPLCSKNRPNRVSLSVHFLKHASAVDVVAECYFCETCGQIFDNQKLLDEHYQESTCIKKSWDCSLCNIQFETETQLIIHENVHDEPETNYEALENLPCILCDENFTTKDSLIIHTLTHLMKKYVCKECSSSFCTQQAYFQHLKLHPGYQYTCIICGQLAKTKNALKCHVIGVHSEGPAYTCKVCNKSFKTPGRLKTHSHIHEERKKYMCSYCGYTTHKSGDLQIHIRSHTSERPYKCTIAQCNMRFKTSSHLCSHLRRHLNIRNFTCSICNVSFGTRHSLKVHHMLHTGEKPYNCIVCEQKFRRKYHLKVHMKQHQPKAA